MDKIVVKNGLVGFFDILGYKNLLSKNDPEDIANKILPFLINVQENTNNEMIGNLSHVLSEDSLRTITKAFNWIVISDSILITLEYLEDDTLDTKLNKWIFFLITSLHLEILSFQKGLPLRGAISCGSYSTAKNCFVGHPIVETYNLSNELEMSATVLCDKGLADLKDLEKQSGRNELVNSPFLCNFLVPLKNEEKHHQVLAAYKIDKEMNHSVDEQIYKSFWKHNKDISKHVDHKIQNTCKFQTYLKLQKEITKS